MNKYYYDFHIHSCLSPCADDDMTPNNIAGMAVLAGLNIVALTDHNSSKNCPAFFEAAKSNGLIPIAGMELTTAEDIHVVCLFPTLENSLSFDEYVSEHRMKVQNRPDIFGKQLILDKNDEPIGCDDFFLPAATDIAIECVPEIVCKYSGVCYPAHIDREANGIIATLGVFPDIKGFNCAEFYDITKKDEYLVQYKNVAKKRILVSSDAHYLWNIRDKSEYFELNDEPYSGQKVTNELFNLLCEEHI